MVSGLAEPAASHYPQYMVVGIQILGMIALAAGEPGASELLDAKPTKQLSPTEVVRIQLAALAHNGLLGADRGIAVTWRFASPSNKAATGPLVRFRAMVKAGYPAMLDHRRSELGRLDISAVQAKQLVLLEDQKGDVHAYVWVLGLQEEGVYRGCWMTEAVVELGPPPPESTSKAETTVTRI